MSQNIGFISDIHLSPSENEITALFEKYIKTRAPELSELYILGDLFDYWIGIDYNQEYNERILTMLKDLSATTKVFFMHGNRDFLIKSSELSRYNITLLKDPSIITIDGKKILLTHGDKFCTLDYAYQIMRMAFQNPITKKLFLSMPLKIRKLTAKTTRDISKKENSRKDLKKVSTVTKAVLSCAKSYSADLIIHGHTHQKQIDRYENCTRIILPSWDRRSGSELSFTPTFDNFFHEVL